MQVNKSYFIVIYIVKILTCKFLIDLALNKDIIIIDQVLINNIN